MQRLLFLWTLLASCFFVRGQDPNDVQPPALALHFVLNDFASVKTPAGASFHETKAGLAASYLRGLSRRLDITATVSGSILRFPFRKGLADDGQELLLLEGDVSLRCKLLPYYHWLSPYVRGGLGLSGYQGKIGFLAPVGVGTQVNLTTYTFLLLEAQYRPSLTENQTGHFFYSLGLGGIISKKKRPIVGKRAPLPVLTPEAPAAYHGDLDSDGDGIPDSQDSCPHTPGLAKYQGCPPPAAGGERVADTVIRKIRSAAGRVYFATGKYSLLPASYPALDEVAGMLKDNPSLKMEIQGHTDSVGSDSDNRLLSQRRAEAVQEHLLGKGVASGRLKARGYGPGRPIASNTTEAGRALNRRVEFRVEED